MTGTYTPATGDTILNDTTFSGPGQWTFSRATTGKWQFKHGTDFYLTTSSNLDWFETTNAVDGLPEEVDLNTLLFGSETDNQVRLSEANFVDRTISEKRALARGRDSANRFRIRASDIFLSITADGRSFALEDLSVDIEQRTFQEQFVMGLSDLFGDEGDRDAAMAAAFRQFKSEMTGYLAEFEVALMTSLVRLLPTRY